MYACTPARRRERFRTLTHARTHTCTHICCLLVQAFKLFVHSPVPEVPSHHGGAAAAAAAEQQQ
eukprot:1274937-Lingulodinium_polyedra.AAC.1